MKKIKKICFGIMTFCIAFMCFSNVYCAKSVRTLKTGDIIYFDNTNTNWQNVKIYLFNDSNGEYKSWSGTDMTKVSDNIYSFTITEESNIENMNIKHLVFNNGEGGDQNQTIDLGFIDTGYAFKSTNASSSSKKEGYWYVYDKTELEKLYKEAVSYEKMYYTEESFLKLEEQIKKTYEGLNTEILVEVVGDNQYETTYDVLLSDLKKAIENLVVNKELIKDKIDEVKQINLDGYTEESVNNLNKAVTSAEEKYVLDNVTVDDVKEQINLLDDAVNELKVDKSGLELLIAIVNEVIETSGEYIASESLTELKNAISAGADVVNNEQATVNEVNSAIENIEQIANSLKFNDELIKALIQKANETDFDKYTDESVEILKSAIAEAEGLLNKDKITIEEFEQVKEKVNNALNNLVEKNEIIEEKSNPNTGNNIILLIAGMFIALTACGSTIIYSKK